MVENCFIPAEEFKERIARIREAMRAGGIDLLLVFSTESEPAGVRYFSDYWPSFESAGVLIPLESEPALLVGPESLTFAESRSRIESILRIRDFRESSMPDYPGSKLVEWTELMGRFVGRRLGIAGWHLIPRFMFENIAAVLGEKNMSDADEVLREVTMRKSPAELDCLREAARISELGFKAVLESIRPGMTEVQLAGIATGAMLANGAEATGYPIWCCSGPNSTQAISRPTHRKVKEGEIIHFSIGAKVSGYSASIGRPVVLGECPLETRRFLQVGLDAENMAIDLMQAGTPASDVARQVHGYIADQGYGHTILYGPAHACGQMECEFPFVETSSSFTLEENMAFMVDVFLADGTMGFRWEDGVIIRNGKPEVLSHYKRAINII